MKGPAKISDVLKNVMGSLSETQPRQQDIQVAWEGAVEKDLAGHVKISSFRKGRLLVLADSSPWLYKATISKNEIIKKLNEALGLGEGFVKRIDFKIG